MLSALIVDDNYALRSAIARSLERRGWLVASAPDGLQGLDAVRRRSFDVVISDVHMPGRGGLWLWRAALELRPELRGRFVLMSSEPLPHAVTFESSLESEEFCLKPFSLITLASLVESIAQRFNADGAETPGSASRDLDVAGR